MDHAVDVHVRSRVDLHRVVVENGKLKNRDLTQHHLLTDRGSNAIHRMDVFGAGDDFVSGPDGLQTGIGRSKHVGRGGVDALDNNVVVGGAAAELIIGPVSTVAGSGNQCVVIAGGASGKDQAL